MDPVSDNSGDECDISWLTQTPSQHRESDNIQSDSEEEIDVVGLVPSLEANLNVHLASVCSKGHQNRRILYDNVEIEISSDDEIDKM